MIPPVMESSTGFGPDIEQRFTLGEPIRRDDKLLSCHAADERGRDVVLTFVTPRDQHAFLEQARLLSGVVHPVMAPILDWGDDRRALLHRPPGHRGHARSIRCSPSATRCRGRRASAG